VNGRLRLLLGCTMASFALSGVLASPALAGCGFLGLFSCAPAPAPAPSDPAPAPAPAPAQSSFLGLFPMPAPPPAPPPDVNSDGSLIVAPADNPLGLQPLPRPVAGQPIYRSGGRVETGFSAFDDAQPAAMSAYVSSTAPLGTRTVRFAVSWPLIQPKNANSWDWSGYDAVYRGALRAGLRPLWTMAGTPCWAQGTLLCFAPSQGLPAASKIGAFATYATELVKRYPLSAGVEFFNEIDWSAHSAADTGRVEPERYASLVSQTYDSIRSKGNAGRNVPVLVGSLLFPPTDPNDATGFLPRAFASGSLAGHYDAISMHYYPYTYAAGSNPATLTQMLTATGAIMARYGDGGRRIVITESGTSLDATDASQAMTPQQRADVTRATWTAFNADPRADALWFFRYVDDQHRFGFMQPDSKGTLVPRANFCALVTTVQPSASCTPVATEG
jgi:hypothetical protein